MTKSRFLALKLRYYRTFRSDQDFTLSDLNLDQRNYYRTTRFHGIIGPAIMTGVDYRTCQNDCPIISRTCDAQDHRIIGLTLILWPRYRTKRVIRRFTKSYNTPATSESRHVLLDLSLPSRDDYRTTNYRSTIVIGP